MTIEYKDSKRIVGLSTDTVQTITFQNDFTTDNMVDQHSARIGINTTTGKVDFDAQRDGSNDASSWDLGSTVSNSNWVMDFEVEYSNISGTGANEQLSIGLFSTDSSSNQNSTSDDKIVFYQVKGTSGNKLYLYGYDGSTNYTNSPLVNLLNTTDIFYVRMIRENTTTIKLEVYDDSGRTNLIGSDSTTVSGITNLRYFKVSNYSGTSYSSSATIIGTVDNLKIYDGVSSVTSKPTNVQDNSLFVEKDTARRYWFDAESENTKTVDDDFSGADNWTDSDSTIIGVNTTTDVLDFKEKDGDFDEVSYYAITALGTDADFTLRLKLNIGTITQTGNTDSVRTLIGISSNNDIPTGTARDEVGIIWRVTDTINKFYAFTADGIALPNSGTDFATTPSTTGGDGSGNYYVEIIGDSGTYTFKLFSDSTYDTLIESESITDAGITGLDNIVIRSSTLTTTNNQARGYIDDVKFYDGVTSTTIPATWTTSSGISKTGCLVHYNFEDTGNTLTNLATTTRGFTDGLGSSANGTNGGATQSQTGVVDNAWSFDNSNDYVNTNISTTVMDTPNTFSISMWIKPNSSSDWNDVLVGQSVGTTDQGMVLWLNSLKPTLYLEGSGGGSTVGLYSSGNAISSGAWNHVVITVVGQSSRASDATGINIYLNGTSQTISTSGSNGTVGTMGVNSNMFLASKHGTTGFFDGLMDEVSIWNRVLTQAEVTRLYNSGNGVGV